MVPNMKLFVHHAIPDVYDIQLKCDCVTFYIISRILTLIIKVCSLLK